MGRSVSVPRSARLVTYDALVFEDDEEDMNEWTWRDFVEGLKDMAKEKWPSLQEDDKWRRSEDHVLLTNRLAEFGVSEYCGLVSIWMVPTEESSLEPFALGWLAGISETFHATFGSLRKVGTFSNGEAVFESK